MVMAWSKRSIFSYLSYLICVLAIFGNIEEIESKYVEGELVTREVGSCLIPVALWLHRVTRTYAQHCYIEPNAKLTVEEYPVDQPRIQN